MERFLLSLFTWALPLLLLAVTLAVTLGQGAPPPLLCETCRLLRSHPVELEAHRCRAHHLGTDCYRGER